jgi:hypothetical protein
MLAGSAQWTHMGVSMGVVVMVDAVLGGDRVMQVSEVWAHMGMHAGAVVGEWCWWQGRTDQSRAEWGRAGEQVTGYSCYV